MHRLEEREHFTKAFTDFKPQKVVNLVAQAGVLYSIENPYAYVEANLVGFLNIIELCRNNDVEGLIYASSSSVYGGNKKIPFSVEDRLDKPIALYGATKRTNELIAHAYSHFYGFHTTGLRSSPSLTILLLVEEQLSTGIINAKCSTWAITAVRTCWI